MKGMIKFYNKEKGFGFIVSENNNEYYFDSKVITFGHIPNSGDLVEFEIYEKLKNNEKNPKIKTMTFLGQSADKTVNDSRILCPHCQKSIVPRTITSQGVMLKTYCPFCSKTIKEFPTSKIVKIFAIIFAVIIITILVSVWFLPVIKILIGK